MNPTSLSLIVPAFNEEQRLPSVLADYISFLSQHIPDFEVLVVDDGSTDGTANVVADFAQREPRVRCISLKANAGKGNAVRTGMLVATKEYHLFADADGSTPIAELQRLYRELERERAQVAIGSRAKESADTVVQSRVGRKLLGRIFNFAINVLVVPGIQDTQCGFKLFRRQASEEIFSRCYVNGFSFDIEVLYLAKQLGLKVVEVPVNWVHVPGSKVRVLRDGVKMFFSSLSIRLRHNRVQSTESRS